MDKFDQFHFIELVHPQQPLGFLSVAPRLAAEAGAESGIFNGKLVL